MAESRGCTARADVLVGLSGGPTATGPGTVLVEELVITERSGLVPQQQPQAQAASPGRGFLAISPGLLLCGCLVLLIAMPFLFVAPLGYIICNIGFPPPTQTAELVEDGAPYVNWWRIPHPQPFGQLQHWKKNAIQNFTVNGSSFAIYSAKDAAEAMYHGTKVSGLFEHVPERLRGVFWMRGNPVGEELIVLQFGQWFEEQGIHVQPLAPYNWAWAYGEPSRAPWFGQFYGIEAAEAVAGFLITPALANSFKFSSCPRERFFCKGVEGSLAYANMQSHLLGYMGSSTLIGGVVDALFELPTFLQGIVSGKYTLQEVKRGKEAGSLWRRTCRWGVGYCHVFDIGSYDLAKIIDEDGTPVEPYYSKFVKYMGDVPLLLWTGFESQAARQGIIEQYEAFIDQFGPPESLKLSDMQGILPAAKHDSDAGAAPAASQ